MSALITRASISSVTRAASRSARRPRWRACAPPCGRGTGPSGARITSAAAIAVRDGPRRFGRMRGALGDHRQDGVRPGVRGLLAQPLAEVLGRRVADDQNLLARLHAEAVPYDRAHRSIEVAARHAASLCAARIRPWRRPSTSARRPSTDSSPTQTTRSTGSTGFESGYRGPGREGARRDRLLHRGGRRPGDGLIDLRVHPRPRLALRRAPDLGADRPRAAGRSRAPTSASTTGRSPTSIPRWLPLAGDLDLWVVGVARSPRISPTRACWTSSSDGRADRPRLGQAAVQPSDREGHDAARKPALRQRDDRLRFSLAD